MSGLKRFVLHAMETAMELPFLVDPTNADLSADVDMATGQPVTPHLLAVADRAVELDRLGIHDDASFLVRQAWYFTALGLWLERKADYERAESFFRRALTIDQELNDQFDFHRHNYATSCINLAHLCFVTNRFGESERLLRHVIDMLEQHDDRSNVYAYAIGNLGLVCLATARDQESQSLLRRCRDILLAKGCCDPGKSASALNNLAELLRIQGKCEEAAPLCLEALNIVRKHFGDRDPRYLIGLNNLALTYHNLGRLDRAEELYSECLLKREAAIGKMHPHNIFGLNNLAEVYRESGKLSEAEECCNRAIDLAETIPGGDLILAVAVNNLALVHQTRGRLNKAEACYARSLSIRHELLGEKHPSYATCLGNLAGLRFQQGHAAEAEATFVQVLSLYTDTLGDHDQRVMHVLKELLCLYQLTGQTSKADRIKARLDKVDCDHMSAKMRRLSPSIESTVD